MTLLLLLFSVVTAEAQFSYTFGFRIYNATCETQKISWHAFVANTGNVFNVGNGQVTVAPGKTVPVYVGGSFDWGFYGGYIEVVDSCSQIAQHVWQYGTPCETGATPPNTNTIGTNVVVKTIYIPVYARVHVPGGSDTNALVRIYKKTILTSP